MLRNKKIIATFLIIITLLSIQINIAFADNTPQPQGNWFEKIFTSTVVSIFEPLKIIMDGHLDNLLMPQDGDTLSFYESNLMTKAKTKITESTMLFGDPKNGIMAVGDKIRFLLILLVAALMPVTMVYTIIKYQNSINPDNRKKLVDLFVRWCVTFILLIFSRQIMIAIYQVNSYVINIFRYASVDSSGKVMNFLENMSFADYGILWVIIWGAYKLITAWIALVIFPMRDIVLILLYTLSPILIYQFIYESKTEVTINWVREFFGTVMTQSVYAFMFWVLGELLSFFDLVGSINTQLDFLRAIMVIIFLSIMITSNRFIRQWLGLDTSGHDALQYLGMGALLGIGNMLFQGGLAKSISGAIKGGNTEQSNVAKNSSNNTNTEGTIAETFKNAQVKASKYAAIAGKIASVPASMMTGIALGPEGFQIGETAGNAMGNFVVGQTAKRVFAGKQIKELNNKISTDDSYKYDYTNYKGVRSVYNEGIRPYMSEEEQEFIHNRNRATTIAKIAGGTPAAAFTNFIYNKKSKNIPKAYEGYSDSLLTQKVSSGDIFDVAYHGNTVEYYKIVEGTREKTPFHVTKTNKNYGIRTMWERYQAGDVVSKGHQSPLAWNKIHDLHYEDPNGNQIPIDLPNSGRSPFLDLN